MAGRIEHGRSIRGRPVHNHPAVRGPGGRRIWARVGRDLNQSTALVGIIRRHHPDVGVVVAVRLGGAVAGECDFLAVGRPHRIGIVVVSRCDLRSRFRLHIEHIKMSSPAIEIADIVGLELEAVDHPRRFCVFLLATLFCLHVLGPRILEHQHHPRTVGRPLVGADALEDVGQLLRVTTLAEQGPDLGSAFLGR